MQIADIVRRISDMGTNLVEITGGEPLIQPESLELLEVLCDQNFDVLLETSGGVSLKRVDSRVRTIMDIKCPDSGESKNFLRENIDFLKAGRDEVKFVISSKRDFEWAVKTCLEYSLHGKAEVLVSPALGRVSPSEMADWVLAAGLPLRFQLQLHTLIWPLEKGER